MLSDTLSVFDWLLGDWVFTRNIPGYATATGQARIVREAEDRARYEEIAQVSLLDGTTLRGTQCYLYRRRPDSPSILEVFFCESGELFERLEFQLDEKGRLTAEAHFLCAADEYISEYTLEACQRLHVSHTVRGPRKNYQVETRYERLTASSSPQN